ncbi:hypothetical protein [Burkholderia plantarii]|uniref:hypothetical protein n=1 Tax=Burkholderia plantarii TaxID=41899 RepID=UPI001D051319|nr:hypothetical protein [Burkholderia plantarii]
MPTSAGVREIIPRLPRFAERHPLLRIDVVLDDRRQDLVRDAVDVAIRTCSQRGTDALKRLGVNAPRQVSVIARSGAIVSIAKRGRSRGKCPLCSVDAADDASTPNLDELLRS